MKIIKAKDYEDMSTKAANIIFSQIILNPKSVLGLATGSTMLSIYKNLVSKYKAGELDFSTVSSVNLDEYLGLSAEDSQSYHYYMNENLFNHINILKENTNVPNGIAEDPEKECKDYDKIIESLGGIDLQLLGLGVDGHIGFNEPGDCFVSPTHIVDLDETTIKANARFFTNESDVPTKALTMGMGSIMKAKRVLLCANGKSKTEILNKVLFQEITPKVPGSILQLHPNLTVIADPEALP